MNEKPMTGSVLMSPATVTEPIQKNHSQ